MSSFRNTTPRRPHRERAQPHSRAHHGLLEKQNDYRARARDFKTKQARLKTLRSKATNRNPDEFSFGMLRGSTNNGVKLTSRGNQSLSNDVVKLMKTQDAGYLRMIVGKTRKEREKLEGSWCAKDNAEVVAFGGREIVDSRHTVFVDRTEDLEDFEAERWFSTDGVGLEKKFNRPKVVLENVESISTVSLHGQTVDTETRQAPETRQIVLQEQKDAERYRAKSQEARAARLEGVKKRERALLLAADALDQQRARMGNSVGGVNKNGVAFKIRRRNR